MYRKRHEDEQKHTNSYTNIERIISVILDEELGLCIEVSDDENGKAFLFKPTEKFIVALSKELDYHMSNSLGEISYRMFRRVLKRLEEGIMRSI